MYSLSHITFSINEYKKKNNLVQPVPATETQNRRKSENGQVPTASSFDRFSPAFNLHADNESVFHPCFSMERLSTVYTRAARAREISAKD